MFTIVWLLSRRGRDATSSVIRDLLQLTHRPDILSMAGGLPAPESFPVDRLPTGWDGETYDYAPDRANINNIAIRVFRNNVAFASFTVKACRSLAALSAVAQIAPTS